MILIQIKRPISELLWPHFEKVGAILDLGRPLFRPLFCLSFRPSVPILFLLNILRTNRSNFTKLCICIDHDKI